MVRPVCAVVASMLLSSCAMQAPSPSAAVSPALRAEIAPSGTLVAAINYGNTVITQRPAPGQDPQGVAPEIARELAKRLGVPIRYVTYEIAGKVADAAKEGVWDIAFLAVDPARSQVIGFSAPYVLIEGTYMVRRDSPLRQLADFDRPGLRIAVGDKSAYDLFLARHLKQSQLVRYPTSQLAIDAFVAGQTDAVAGVKQALAANAAKTPGLRLIDGAYMSIDQAAGVPVTRPNAARYLHGLVEELKASGFIARHLARTGNADATVAPLAR
jgi:polar amino acid transport system substrate-binding protein